MQNACRKKRLSKGTTTPRSAAIRVSAAAVHPIQSRTRTTPSRPNPSDGCTQTAMDRVRNENGSNQPTCCSPNRLPARKNARTRYFRFRFEFQRQRPLRTARRRAVLPAEKSCWRVPNGQTQPQNARLSRMADRMVTRDQSRTGRNSREAIHVVTARSGSR